MTTPTPRTRRARPLRVLMIVESSGGGTGRHVLDLSEGLLQRGCEVHLLYSTGRIDALFSDRLRRIGGLRHSPLPMRTSIHPSDLAVLKAVRRYLLDHGPFDVVHGHSSKGGACARLSALGTGVRAFYTIHGLLMMDPDLALWKRLLYRTIEAGLGFCSANIIAVSPEERRAAVRYSLGSSRLVLIPNGVGEPQLTPRGEVRRSLGVSAEQVVIGFVGRLVSQKAPHVLLDAFAATAHLAPHAVLALVGNGPLNEALREQAQKLGVYERVLWLGERDARGVLAGFDVFAIASRKEGLPYVVLEAMAAGLPVVATRSAGVELLIEPGSNGYVVPTDDAEAFRQRLTALAGDAALRSALGQSSLRRAQRFTIAKMVDATLSIYRKNLRHSPSAANLWRAHT